ncbi:MAG: hypothetical protein H9W81_04375 [Enterococcus sp.]|nr:hypothetical protein [Enterococcus sp.]
MPDEKIPSKETAVHILTNASSHVMPHPLAELKSTHHRVWDEMSAESLDKMLETFLAEGSIYRHLGTGELRINYDIIDTNSELAKTMQAFIDVLRPNDYYREMEFREKINIPTTELRVLVQDDLEGTLKARGLI